MARTMAQALFNQLVENLLDAVFVLEKPFRRIVYVNQAACDMFGYPAEHLVESTTELLHVDADHFARFHSWSSEVLARQPQFRGEFRMRRANGETFPTHHSVSLFTDESGTEFAVSVVRDISEQHAQQAALRKSETRFRQIAENLREVFWIADPSKTRMEYVSPAYETIWGLSVDSLYDDPHSFEHAIHPDDRERALALIRQQAHSEYEAEYRIIRADGAVRWIWDRSVPIRDERGEVDRIVGIAEDITILKEREAEALQARKMDALGQLTGGISHDFNNMLTVIMGNVELLLERQVGDESSAALARDVLDATRRARDLVSRLMTFARQKTLRRTSVDLNEMIDRLDALLGRTLGENVRIDVECDPSLWPVLVDRSQIETCLLNLAINARDAMRSGGVLTITTANRKLDIHDADAPARLPAGDYVTIEVRDTGCGIAPDIIDRVFDPFFTTKPPGEGTGMGLSMTYAIVRESGGHVEAESHPGKGSCLRIFLPRQQKPEPQLPVDQHDHPAAGTEKIMVVEDQDMVRNLLVSQLGQLGYHVIEASDGTAALELIDGHPDTALLLSDVIMPGSLNGPQLYQRAVERLPRLKVLLCSGYGGRQALADSGLSADTAMLAKPFRLGQLARAVREVLDTRD